MHETATGATILRFDRLRHAGSCPARVPPSAERAAAKLATLMREWPGAAVIVEAVIDELMAKRNQ